ncbi:MAG: hypothetical protein KJ630_07045 [Proteobacteria bacterium]|nr:hypothetical protein [Pseudomonadota bacterium]
MDNWAYNGQEFYNLNDYDKYKDELSGKEGVYVIWEQSENYLNVIYVGQGNLSERIALHINRKEINKHNDVKISWLLLPAEDHDNAEAFLARKLKPEIGDRHPTCPAGYYLRMPRGFLELMFISALTDIVDSTENKNDNPFERLARMYGHDSADELFDSWSEIAQIKKYPMNFEAIQMVMANAKKYGRMVKVTFIDGKTCKGFPRMAIGEGLWLLFGTESNHEIQFQNVAKIDMI